MTTIEKPFIAEELLLEFKTQVEEEKQVIVHCCFPKSPLWGSMIRIWQSTYLLDKGSSHKSKLLFAENISIFPHWTPVVPMKDFWFTLIFSGLPKECKSFDLAEIIPEENGFFVENIRRNETDVYKIKI